MNINGSAQQLRALHYSVRKALGTLKNLDISTKFCDSICFIIRRKLDQQAPAALENFSFLALPEKYACSENL